MINILKKSIFFLLIEQPIAGDSIVPENRTVLFWVKRMLFIWFASLLMVQIDLFIIHLILGKGGLDGIDVIKHMAKIFAVSSPIIGLNYGAFKVTKMKTAARGISGTLPTWAFLLSLVFNILLIILTVKLNTTNMNFEDYTDIIVAFSGFFLAPVTFMMKEFFK